MQVTGSDSLGRWLLCSHVLEGCAALQNHLVHGSADHPPGLATEGKQGLPSKRPATAEADPELQLLPSPEHPQQTGSNLQGAGRRGLCHDRGMPSNDE